METTQLNITGMVCDACAGHVETALKSVEGVRSVEVDLAAGRATAEHTGAKENVLVAAVADAGYQVEIAQGPS